MKSFIRPVWIFSGLILAVSLIVNSSNSAFADIQFYSFKKNIQEANEEESIDWDAIDAIESTALFELPNSPKEQQRTSLKKKESDELSSETSHTIQKRSPEKKELSLNTESKKRSFPQARVSYPVDQDEKTSLTQTEKNKSASKIEQEFTEENTKELPKELSHLGEKTLVSAGELSIVDADEYLAQSDPSIPPEEPQTVLIKFNNVSVIEYIRFISRVAGRNFILDEEDLFFNVTIISEEPTTIDNVLMSLLHELRIHGFNMIDLGNTIIIFQAEGADRAPGEIVSDLYPLDETGDADIQTRIFRLNTQYADTMASVISSLLSDSAIVNTIPSTNHLIVTDFASNINRIAQMIRSVDAPNGSQTIGQYVVRNAFIDILIENAEMILSSVAPEQNITLLAHSPSNSIFIIASPFIVERAIPILQRLDTSDGTTGIYDLEKMKYSDSLLPMDDDAEGPGKGKWRLDADGNWYYDVNESGDQTPQGYWIQDSQGNWKFIPGSAPSDIDLSKQPKGRWKKGSDGKWHFFLEPGESIYAGRRIRTSGPSSNLPFGHLERTKFYIHKLKYRKGEEIEKAILKIGESLADTEAVNGDLIATINSVQWLETSNSLVVTGTPDALYKVKELIEELDQPLRQVFIEMLILRTNITDSLDYSINWASKFGGGDQAGAQAFASGASQVQNILASSGVNDNVNPPEVMTPTATNAITGNNGYNLGIIGQSISVGGIEFKSLAALVRAVHEKTTTEVVMNPKILTEDNVTAEIFVGENTRFQTQAVSNDQGSIITNNFEFRDVGTTLKVTPLLGPTNIISLEIDEEVSSIANQGTGSGLADINPGPTTSINRTKTTVHVPDGYFLAISGMIRDETRRTRNHVPCLGGAPIIGAAFTGKGYRDEKSNLLIFIRPQLVDTEEQIDNLTKHQQNIFRIKKRQKKMWQLDTEEALDWMNLMQTDTNNYESPCCHDRS